MTVTEAEHVDDKEHKYQQSYNNFGHLTTWSDESKKNHMRNQFTVLNDKKGINSQFILEIRCS